jgi:hypothetical protein
VAIPRPRTTGSTTRPSASKRSAAPPSSRAGRLARQEAFSCLGVPRVFNRGMETAQESEPRQNLAEIDPLARPRLGSDELRASLEAVRSAQAAARARARRETRWARGIAAGALMAVAATAWAAAHRPTRARAGATGARVVAAGAPSVAPHAAPSIAPSPQEPPPSGWPAPSKALPRSGAAVPGDSGGQVAACDAALEQRSWTTVASTCAAAFEARPGESALAMRVAQAQHRRGHLATAADWARKALAVDADIPEAFVIIARAEVGAGHAQPAADAYRRYLTLAPRGWHAAEARRALRADR